MFGNNNQSQSGIRAFFGPKGSVSAVFDSSSNMSTVVGSGNRDGTYFRNGNMISGSEYIHIAIGDGPMKTIFYFHGETRMTIENDLGGAVL